MATFIDPRTQYLTVDGKLAARSSFEYFDSGTLVPKAIFADAGSQTALDNPVLTNDRGELPQVFFDGVARVIRNDRSSVTGDADIFRWDLDPVQGAGGVGTFPQWSSEVNYPVGSIVQDSNGRLQQSLVTPNLNNDPTSTSGFWETFPSLNPLFPYAETLEAVAASDIDQAEGNYFTKTLSANTTFTFSNALSNASSFTLRVKNAVTGGFTVTFPASVTLWRGGAEPTLGDDDLIVFVTEDSGTSYYGVHIGELSTV